MASEQQHQRERLQQRRNELRDRLENIRRDLQERPGRDLDEQALRLENEDQLIEIQRVTRQELARVEDQLDKLH